MSIFSVFKRGLQKTATTVSRSIATLFTGEKKWDSAMFEELLDSLKEPNEERINDLKIALHNIPIILADEHKRIKKHIAREISFYRNKWNKHFLEKLIK